MKKQLLIGLVTLLPSLSFAANNIPQNYLGSYLDSNAGVKIVLDREFLSGSKAELTSKNIGSQKMSVDELERSNNAKDDLNYRTKQITKLLDLQGKGKPLGLVDQSHKDFYDFYLIAPKAKTARQEAEGYVWYQAAIAIGQFEAEPKSKVLNFKAEYCENGTVLINAQTKEWTLGCSDDAALLSLVRKK